MYQEFLFPKRSDPSDPENYQPICIITIMKVLHQIVTFDQGGVASPAENMDPNSVASTTVSWLSSRVPDHRTRLSKPEIIKSPKILVWKYASETVIEVPYRGHHVHSVSELCSSSQPFSENVRISYPPSLRAPGCKTQKCRHRLSSSKTVRFYLEPSIFIPAYH